MVELYVRKIRDYSYHQLQQLVKKSDKADLLYLLKDVGIVLNEKNEEKNIAKFPRITSFPYKPNSYEQALVEEHVYKPLLEDIDKLEVLEKEIKLKLNELTTITKESPPIPQVLLDALENEKLIKVIKTSPLELEWIGAKNLCAYFVRCYLRKDNRRSFWKIGRNIFKVSNLAQLHNDYINSNTGTPIGYEIIDRILQDYERQRNSK